MKFADRVKVSTSTTGTGTVIWGLRRVAFRRLHRAVFRMGIPSDTLLKTVLLLKLDKGFIRIQGTTLTRVLKHSSTGSLLNLSGSATVFISPSADDLTLSSAAHNFTEFTATAGQTNFSPVSYKVGNILVFMNGTKLDAGSFTATSGSGVDLASAASAGDIIEVVEYGGASANYSTTEFTATSGQTAFTGSYNNNKSEVY